MKASKPATLTCCQAQGRNRSGDQEKVSEEVKDTHTLSGTKGGINQDTMRKSEGYSQAE
jgi:hypothetical protein